MTFRYFIGYLFSSALPVAASLSLLAAPTLAASKPTYAHKMEMGNMSFFNGDIIGAIRAFEYAAQLNPKAFEPHLNLVNLYINKGGDDAMDKAINECHEVLKRKPGQKDVHLILGNLLRNQASSITDPVQMNAKLDEAIKELGLAEEAGANDALCENTMGVILLQKGDRAGALKHIDLALKDQPVFADAHLIRAVLLFKEIQGDPKPNEPPPDLTTPDKKAKLDEVLKELDLAIKQKDKNAEALNTKADILFAMGKHEDAAKHYQDAADAEPRYAQAWAGLGNTHVQKKNWDEARKAYEKAKQLKPDDKNILYGLAVMMEKAGERELAIDEFQKSLMLETDPQWRYNIQAHLQQLGGGTAGGFGGITGAYQVNPFGQAQPGSSLFTGGALSQPFKDLIKIKEPGGGGKEKKESEK